MVPGASRARCVPLALALTLTLGPGCTTILLVRDVTYRDLVLEGRGPVSRLRWRGDAIYPPAVQWRVGEREVSARPVATDALGGPLPVPEGGVVTHASVPASREGPGVPDAVAFVEAHGIPYVLVRADGRWDLGRAATIVDEHVGLTGRVWRVLLLPLAVGWDLVTSPFQGILLLVQASRVGVFAPW